MTNYYQELIERIARHIEEGSYEAASALIEEELKRVPNEKVRRIATEHIEDIRSSDHRDFRF